MTQSRLDTDLPITRRRGLRSYVFAGKRFFTRRGAENSRMEYVIMLATVRGHIRKAKT